MICDLRAGWPCRGWPGEAAMMCLFELSSKDEGFTVEQGRRVYILAHHQGARVK